MDVAEWQSSLSNVKLGVILVQEGSLCIYQWRWSPCMVLLSVSQWSLMWVQASTATSQKIESRTWTDFVRTVINTFWALLHIWYVLSLTCTFSMCIVFFCNTFFPQKPDYWALSSVCIEFQGAVRQPHSCPNNEPYCRIFFFTWLQNRESQKKRKPAVSYCVSVVRLHDFRVDTAYCDVVRE